MANLPDTFAVLDVYEKQQLPFIVDRCRTAGIIKTLREKLPSLTTDGVSEYRQIRLRNGMSGTTVNKEVGTLLAACNLARANGYNIPAIAFRRAPLAHRDSYCTVSQIQSIIDSADDIRFRIYIVLLFMTGQRKATVQGLRWSQIQGDVIKFSYTPSDCMAARRKKRATTPITPELKDAIGLMPRGKSDFLFMDDETGHMMNQRLDRWLGSTSKKLGIKCSAHVMRHSAITLAMDAPGADLYRVSQFAGHSSTAITQRIYLHGRPGQQAGIVSSLGGMVRV